MRFLSSVKEDLQPSQHIVQGYTSFWRMFIFIIGAFVVNVCQEVDAKSFFLPTFNGTYKVNLIAPKDVSQEENCLTVDGFMPLYVFAVQAVCAMTMYQSCKSIDKFIEKEIIKILVTFKDPKSKIYIYLL